MKKCPYCAEEIKNEAIICKHCGKDLQTTGNNKIKVNQHPSYGAFTALGLLIAPVGLIVGIVYLTKNNELDKKLGEHTIAISILGLIIGYTLYYFYFPRYYYIP